MSRDTRLWMYRKGEARLFGHPDHVPEGEDWRRFPVIAEAADIPASPTEAQDSEIVQDEELDGMSYRRLMRTAADRGVSFDASWSKAQLRQAIREVLHGERA